MLVCLLKMNNVNNQSYIKYFLLALGLHGFVLAVVTFNHSSQETLTVSAEPKTNLSKEIAAAIVQVQPDVPKKVKVAELQKLVETQEQEKPDIDIEAVQLEKQEKLEKQQKIKAQKLAAEKLVVEKLAKEQLEKSKAEQLVKLEKEKREQEKIQAAQLLEEKKRLLEQKRIAQVQQEIREAAQKRIIQAQQVQQELAAQQELAVQEQRANEQAQLLRMIDRYALLMRAKIHQNWRRPVGMDNLYKCKVAVKLGPQGEVISASVIDSSGNIEFDRSAELAIRKSSPLPLPSDEKMRAPFNNFTFTFDPQMA